MAQTNVIAREHRTLIGMETTFGTTPSMTEIVPQHDALHIDGLALEMLEVNDARARRNDAIQPINGLQMASKVSMTCYAKAPATSNILTAGGTVGTLSQCIALKHALGVEHAAIGTTVASAVSATTFDVTSAANIKKGTFITVTIAGIPEVTKVTNISTATLTVSPALSTTPAGGVVVRNLRTYAPAESHTSSLSMQFAFCGSADAQYTVNGVCCSIKVTCEFGKLITYALDGQAASYTGPEPLSITATSVTDDMSAPFVWKSATVLIGASGSLARSDLLVCESIELDLPNNWQAVRDPGGVETVNSMVNVAGRPRAATLKLRLRFDTDLVGDPPINGDLGFLAWVPYGSGTTTRYFVLEMARCNVVGKPKATKVGELLYYDIELGALMDNTVTLASETGTDLDLIRAPYRVAFG